MRSQNKKRFYINGAIYFITTNTYNRYPYFKNDALCELFVEELQFYQKIKKFEVYGYKINYDHIHLLIQPCSEYNISKIMHCIKKNFAQDVNKLIIFLKNNGNGGMYPDFQKGPFDLLKYKLHVSLPKFKWQGSYHDHIIRDQIDFNIHLKYIQKQWIKHKLDKNKFCFVNLK